MVIGPSCGHIPHMAGQPPRTWRTAGVGGRTAAHPSRESAPEVSPVPGLNDLPETWLPCRCRRGLVQQISRGQLTGLPALSVAAHGRRAGSW